MFIDSLERIQTRIKRYPPQVVYLDDGKLRTTQLVGSYLDKVLSSKHLKLLGVYDEKCVDTWLEDDLQWADAHWREKE